jgi:hypothetical protein
MKLVLASHTIFQQPTFVIHIGDLSTINTCHVGGKHLASVSQAGGKCPITAIHIGNRSVASASHVIEPSPTFVSHFGDVKPPTPIYVGGIDYVEKPRRIEHKTKLDYNICNGDDLTHMCPGIPEV